ncbi:MAG: 3-dehydroquinate synthase [Beijerinckiaceae bacterium]
MTSATLSAEASNQRHIVRVDLAGRSYDIIIGRGVLQEAGTHIRRIAPKARVAIITDETVAKLHLPALQASLDAAGIASSHCILPAGERTKSFASLETVCDAILEARLERGDIVIALGGGVIGDLTGFAAAIVRRGMQFLQIPTTLLSQVDSSVGGKTAINSPRGKNLIGAFHQPVLVLADTALLDTLPLREFRAGYAEVVKYGFLGDAAFFNWLEAGNWQKVFDGGPEREEAVRISCAAKAAIVARDETEQGDRALLNLGHTFGHALEAAVGYDGSRLVHGEAIAIGMRLAFDFSREQGFCQGQDSVRVRQHLAHVGLPTKLDQVPGGVGTAISLLDAIRQDKKVSRGALTFILAKGIGQSFIAKDVDANTVLDFLERELRPAQNG